MNLISIAMPAYNAGKYIAETIESIIAQTYKDWELIIVDDCSTDTTVSIVEQYIKKNNKITLIKRRENSGGCRLPRFDAILAANGDFVCPIDADDTIEEQYLEKLIKRQKKTNADIVLGRMILCNESQVPQGVTVPHSSYNFERILSGKDACKETIGGWKIAMAGMLAKTDSYKNYIEKHYNDGPNCNFIDEIDHRRHILNADKITIIDAQYYYRQVSGSIIHVKNIRYFDRLKALDILYYFVKSNFYDDTAVMKNMHYEYIGTVSNCRRVYLRSKDNFNKNEKKVINGMIANSFKRIKQEKMRGRTHKQRVATYNFFVFRLLSLIEALLTKHE